MGHNVDLTKFGLCSIRCKICGCDLDLTEVDIDCDLKPLNPMRFSLSIDCIGCEETNDINFSIIEER